MAAVCISSVYLDPGWIHDIYVQVGTPLPLPDGVVPISVLATLFLLSYAKLLRTIIA